MSSSTHHQNIIFFTAVVVSALGGGIASALYFNVATANGNHRSQLSRERLSSTSPAFATTLHSSQSESNERSSDATENSNGIQTHEQTNPSRLPRPTIENTVLQTADADHDSSSLTIRPIGRIRSIYRLCVGTPRQGLLAPHARGKIELYNYKYYDQDDTDNNSRYEFDAMEMVQELQQYSHIWVLFLFHLNTQKSGSSSNKSDKDDFASQRPRTKISPPALGGKKVGVLATRSPHRFNPIGMSLVKLDRIELVKTASTVNSKKPKRIVTLHISGLDLVDETPVIDIKPYVGVYDAPIDGDTCKVPSWVSEGLDTSREVVILDQAKQELHDILTANPKALNFYRGKGAESDILECIKEVLAMDVRSTFQTSKVRKGKFQAQTAERLSKSSSTVAVESVSSDTTTMPLCTQQLDNLMVYYSVREKDALERPESVGSGAEDKVIVQSITLYKSC